MERSRKTQKARVEEFYHCGLGFFCVFLFQVLANIPDPNAKLTEVQIPTVEELKHENDEGGIKEE